jgi:ribosomal protein S18 acetylase RimI-like enzyme
LGELDAVAVGMIGLRAMSPTMGEVRRLYVDPGARSVGLGRRLVQRALNHAAAVGFERLVLATLPGMAAAIALYRSMGFAEAEPHVADPTDGVIYLALELPSIRTR